MWSKTFVSICIGLVTLLVTGGIVLVLALTTSRTDASTGVDLLDWQQSGRRPRESHPVIIGGAGFAGIELARRLHEEGVEFVILEASGRVGGRVKEKTFGGYVLEEGANWIQGLNGNPLWELKKTFGLLGVRNNFDDLVMFDENGTLIVDPYTTAEGIQADEAFVGASTYSRRCLQPSEPLNANNLRFCRGIKGTFVNAQSDDDQSNAEGETLFNGFIADTPVKRTFQYYSEDFEYGQSPGVTSLNNTLPSNTYSDFRDANYMALNDPLGFARLALKQAATYLRTSVNTNTRVEFDDPRLRLRTRVLAVDRSSSDSVDIQICTTSPTTTHVITAHRCVAGSQRTLRGSHFVSTFSLGVLAQSVNEESASVNANSRTAPRFVPPLPPATAAALLDYPMALYSKIFFRFPWKFWQDEEMMLSAFQDGEFAPVWQSLDMTNFLPGSKILFLTVTGERARELQLRPNSPATDTQIINELLPVLNQVFATEIAGVTGGRQLRRSDVLEFSMTRWLQDELARGMYSNWPVNQTWIEQEPTRANLGRVWFSGEHTCFRYNGYVHGAMLAGQRTANLLLAKAFGRRNIDLATTCDQSPSQLTGSQTFAAEYIPMSTGHPRPHNNDES